MTGLESCSYLVHSIEDFENDRVTFKPQFAHQIFGEELVHSLVLSNSCFDLYDFKFFYYVASETIFGYKDLAIDMYYTAGTLKCFIRVNYSGRIEESIEAKVG